MHERILGFNATTSGLLPGELDVAAIATVLATSELPTHPVKNALHHRRGPGGNRWVAATPGKQTLVLTVDAPQDIRQVLLDVEEIEEERAQGLRLAVSCDGGNSHRELQRREFSCSPSGTTFQRKEWIVMAGEVSHLQLGIKPDKAGRPGRASLTTLSLR